MNFFNSKYVNHYRADGGQASAHKFERATFGGNPNDLSTSQRVQQLHKTIQNHSGYTPSLNPQILKSSAKLEHTKQLEMLSSPYIDSRFAPTEQSQADRVNRLGIASGVSDHYRFGDPTAFVMKNEEVADQGKSIMSGSADMQRDRHTTKLIDGRVVN